MDDTWLAAPAQWSLERDEVHVWRTALDRPDFVVRELCQLLTPDEQERASRFCRAQDRVHFMVARGVLRSLLGRYVRRPPEQLRFTYGMHGKPMLAGEPGAETLSFNLSHSGGIALYGITRGRELGIDVETIRNNLGELELAERFFSPREVCVLRALPPAQRREAFFLCWTRKEAYIKATGKGLALPLDQFSVSLTPGEPAALLSTEWQPADLSRWSMQALEPGHGYTAALAVEGSGWRCHCWDYQSV